MSGWLHDFRYAARMLRKSPGFTLVAVMTIALGLGATTAVFAIADHLLLRGLPYPDAKRLVMVWQTEGKFVTAPITEADYQDWRQQQTVFSEVGAGTEAHKTLTSGTAAHRMDGWAVSPETLPMLGARAAMGRLFQESDMGSGHDRVVVLSHALWQQQFGGDASLVGREISLSGEAYTVIGVANEGFHAPGIWIAAPEFWTPIAYYEQQTRASHWLWMLGKLKPGVALQQAQAAMGTIAARLAQQYPETNKDESANVMALADYVTSGIGPMLRLFLLAAGFILAIACANVANLLLAHGSRRRQEIAIRRALGARGWELARQLCAQSLLLSLVGGAAGLLLATWLKEAVVVLAPKGYLPEIALNFDARVFGFAFLAALGCSLLFGMAPAWQMTQVEGSDALKQGARATSGGRVRNSFLVAEIASAVVLVGIAGLGLRSLAKLLGQDEGFNPKGVLAFKVALPETYKSDAEVNSFYQRALERLAALPGVKSVAITSELPLEGYRNGVIWAEGTPKPHGTGGPLVGTATVSRNYFGAMQIPLVAGRNFRPADETGAQPVAIINEAMARRFWPGQQAVGRHFSPNLQDPKWVEVIGVVRNVREYGLRANPAPQYFWPASADTVYGSMDFVIRTDGDAMALGTPAQAAVHELDKNVPVYDVENLEMLVSKSASKARFDSGVLGMMAGLALLLAASGIFAVMSYVVSQGTREIGLRMALGATSERVSREVLGRMLRLAGVGAVIGVAAALGIARSLTTLVFGVSRFGPVSFGGAVGVLLLVAVAATYWPARRAASVDPMVALRQE